MNNKNKKRLILSFLLVIGIGAVIAFFVFKNSSTKQETDKENLETPLTPPNSDDDNPEENDHSPQLNDEGIFGCYAEKDGGYEIISGKKLEADNGIFVIPLNSSPITEEQARDKLWNEYKIFSSLGGIEMPARRHNGEGLFRVFPYIYCEENELNFEYFMLKIKESIEHEKNKLNYLFPSYSLQLTTPSNHTNPGFGTKSEQYWFKIQLKRKKRRAWFSITPRKSENDAHWIKWLEQIEKILSFLTIDKIEEYVKNETNPRLKEWLKKVLEPGEFPSNIEERNKLFNKLVEENMEIVGVAEILIDLWKIKTGKDIFPISKYVIDLRFEPEGQVILSLETQYGKNKA